VTLDSDLPEFEPISQKENHLTILSVNSMLNEKTRMNYLKILAIL
jgi:hypothetical protein